MAPRKSAPKQSNGKFLKVVAAIAMLTGAGYLAIGGYQKVQPNSAINNGNTGDGPMNGGGPEGRPNWEQMQRENAKALGLTAQQEAELQKAREVARETGDWSAIREASNRILTPDQQRKEEELREKRQAERQARQAEREKKMKAMLSESDQKALQERFQRRGGGPGGRRGGGPGGPGGPREGGPGPGTPANSSNPGQPNNS